GPDGPGAGAAGIAGSGARHLCAGNGLRGSGLSRGRGAQALRPLFRSVVNGLRHRRIFAAPQQEIFTRGLQCCGAASILMGINPRRIRATDPQEILMAKTPDFTKPFQDMLANFPVDTSSLTEAFRSQSALSERMTRVALQAAERSTEISAAWAKDTLSRMGELT